MDRMRKVRCRRFVRCFEQKCGEGTVNHGATNLGNSTRKHLRWTMFLVKCQSSTTKEAGSCFIRQRSFAAALFAIMIMTAGWDGLVFQQTLRVLQIGFYRCIWKVQRSTELSWNASWKWKWKVKVKIQKMFFNKGYVTASFPSWEDFSEVKRSIFSETFLSTADWKNRNRTNGMSSVSRPKTRTSSKNQHISSPTWCYDTSTLHSVAITKAACSGFTSALMSRCRFSKQTLALETTKMITGVIYHSLPIAKEVQNLIFSNHETNHFSWLRAMIFFR